MKILTDLHIDYNNLSLYKQAFTHSSYSNEHSNNQDYERLEFLGDAVLELITSDYLFHNFDLEEGVMTKMRASYVCENALYKYATDLNFNDYILVGTGDDASNVTIMADVFEAFIGAMYLDKGYSFTKNQIISIISPYIEQHYNFLEDYKSQLQELVQTVKKSVNYVVVRECGPSHDKTFTVEAKVNGIVMGRGTAKSKKAAEQLAARVALTKQAKI
ncbi:MAG: ribonuclease III [bacterium]|nr:ribonuclease III [bacterium]